MSEEIQNASRVVPTSIITTIVINGSLGLGMILTVLFSLGNVEKALHSPTGYPFMEIFLEATESVAGSTVMASIITILGLCATVGGMASASRMIWSFSRDRGIPGWKILSRVCHTSASRRIHVVVSSDNPNGRSLTLERPSRYGQLQPPQRSPASWP